MKVRINNTTNNIHTGKVSEIFKEVVFTEKACNGGYKQGSSVYVAGIEGLEVEKSSYWFTGGGGTEYCLIGDKATILLFMGKHKISGYSMSTVETERDEFSKELAGVTGVTAFWNSLHHR